MTTITLGRTTDGRAVDLHLNRANRHGLVTGSTGSGKTATLQVLAEGFSRAGVPVFAADIKGDLSGIAKAGPSDGKAAERAARMGVTRTPSACPVRFWDLYRQTGMPMMTSVHEMGSLIMARLMALNETQEGMLNIAARYMAEEWHAPIQTLDDLSSSLRIIADNAEACRLRYGNVTPASVGAIQRRILTLDTQHGRYLFGEPALDIADIMRCSDDGRGIVSLLDATDLMESPRLYGAFMVFLLTRLYETLPEVGDLPQPKLVMFFDEAHLLFHEAPKPLMEKIELMVRLVRSKGVGVYFVTQRAIDVPETVLAQLGNRIQHALRAFTPRDARAVRQIAETYRQNPAVKIEEAITTMGVGEALVSTLQPDGTPMPVERVDIVPPAGQIGPLTAEERDEIRSADPLEAHYAVVRDEAESHAAFRRRIGWPDYVARPAKGDEVDLLGWAVKIICWMLPGRRRRRRFG